MVSEGLLRVRQSMDSTLCTLRPIFRASLHKNTMGPTPRPRYSPSGFPHRPRIYLKRRPHSGDTLLVTHLSFTLIAVPHPRHPHSGPLIQDHCNPSACVSEPRRILPSPRVSHRALSLSELSTHKRSPPISSSVSLAPDDTAHLTVLIDLGDWSSNEEPSGVACFAGSRWSRLDFCTRRLASLGPTRDGGIQRQYRRPCAAQGHERL